MARQRRAAPAYRVWILPAHLVESEPARKDRGRYLVCNRPYVSRREDTRFSYGPRNDRFQRGVIYAVCAVTWAFTILRLRVRGIVCGTRAQSSRRRAHV